MLWISNSNNVYNCAVEKRVSKALTDFSKFKYVKSYFPTADGCLKYTIEHMKWTLFNDMCATKVCVCVIVFQQMRQFFLRCEIQKNY